MPAKHRRPSLTTVLAGSKLRLAFDTAQLDADRLALQCRLDGGEDRGLSSSAATPPAAVPLAADIGVIDLDPASQALSRVPLQHHLHQLVLDLPGRRLGHAQAATKLEAGNAPFALGQVVHGTKPEAERSRGRGEDRPCDERGLPTAGGTLIKSAGLHDAIACHRPTPSAHSIILVLYHNSYG